MMVSVAWVKEGQEGWGGGFGLTQERWLRSLKPSCCMAKPTLWITWAVPETQMEPLGFRTRCAAASQALLNSWIFSILALTGPRSGPRDLSQSPLWTETILPAWQGMPPLERKEGGRAKRRATAI